MKPAGWASPKAVAVVLGVGGRASKSVCLQVRKGNVVSFVCSSWCIGRFLGRLAQRLKGCFKPSPKALLA